MTATAAGNNWIAATGLEFQITDTKSHVPAVALSKENNKKRFEQLKSGFKRTLQ